MTGDTTPGIECSDNALCGCPHCLEDDKILAEMAAEAARNRCDRCEQTHGLCHHTAAPIEVGDTISEHMGFGRWVRANELRPNSRVRDAEGSTWVRTRHGDPMWERIERGPGVRHVGVLWPLYHLVDEAQGYGPLTVVHVAGRRAAR